MTWLDPAEAEQYGITVYLTDAQGPPAQPAAPRLPAKPEVANPVAAGQNRMPPCPISSAETSWNSCQGNRTFDNGNYVGEFRAGIRNGQGTYTFANGEKYVGEFKDGKHHGQGTYTFANGNKYVGEFKDGKLHGQGIYTFANGDKFVGEFKDGEANGQGTITYVGGGKYVGEFRDGKKNGEGTAFAANGSIVFLGIWADDKFLGAVADLASIKMENNGGVYIVPVRFNDSITLDAVVDSGASDVSVPADVVLTLMRAKTITQADFLGKQTYVLADGSEAPSQQFRIRSLKVGNKIMENVVASVASAKGKILLGQSFLRQFKSWSVDNEQHVLILK
jgi:hypothetical protein